MEYWRLGLEDKVHKIVKLNALDLRRKILNEARYGEEKRLLKYGFKGYSQNDEDGIIEEIFRRVGVANKTFVEIGVGNGLENNTLYLLAQGWQGFWIEGNSKYVEQIKQKFNYALKNQILEVQHAFVEKDNVNQLIRKWQTDSGDLDLLSLDIDGNDYHILEAMEPLNARVVVVEYNPKFRPPVKWVMKYNSTHRPSFILSDYFGGSLKSFEILLLAKGYKLVGCSLSGINAFFVREDLVKNHFLDDYSAENHYEPERHILSEGLAPHHFPDFGPFEIK